MLSSHSVECPICFKNFSSGFIESHAQKCKGKEKNKFSPNSSEMPSAKKAKISAPGNQSFFSSKRKLMKSPSNSKILVNDIGRQETPKPTIFNDISIVRSSSKNTNKTEVQNSSTPLAERSRPSTVEDYVGQEQVLGKGCVLSELLNNNVIPSMILWGPPGCGKTSLAHVIAMKVKNNPNNLMRFVKMSATNSGKADVNAAVESAKNDQKMFKRKTILFIDEIHRFNKLQQDTFLPHVEDGTIILIGATTENPSFSLNSALLSRCRVIVLEKLNTEEVKVILLRALKKFECDVKLVPKITKNGSTQSESGTSDIEIVLINNDIKTHKITISEDAIEALAYLCDGDARTALSGLQMAIQAGKSTALDKNNGEYFIDIECIKNSLQRSHVLYDRKGDQHYEIISAFQKSIRGSDENATLYWLARMLEGGEDPKFIARRLIRIASEDIGLADSQALNLAISAQQACQFIGMPECDVILAHCAVYMARAPKSVEVYMAYNRAKESVRYHEGPLPGVPLHLRNASTKFMKDLGYGKGYQHKPTEDNSQTYMPQSMLACDFFDGNLPSFSK